MIMNRIIRLAVLCLIIACSSQSIAQSAGDMVRITTLSEDRFHGFVSEVHPNRVELRLTDGSLKTVPHVDIAKLERNMGKRTYKKRGLLIGGVVGAVIGAAGALFVEGDCGGLVDLYCSSEDKMYVAMATTGISGSIGLLAGAMIKRDRWREVPKPWSGHLQMSPMIKVSYHEHSGQRIQVGLSVRFN